MKRQFARTDDPQFKRDRASGAILNTDNKALEQYLRQRAESLAVQNIAREVAELKDDISEIKELLRKLVSG